MILVALALMGAIPNPTLSQFMMSGRQLFNICRTDDDLNTGICVGYLLAATDQAVFEDTTRVPRRLCVPRKISNLDLRTTVQKSLSAPDAELSLPAILSIRRALQRRFPCPDEATKPGG